MCPMRYKCMKKVTCMEKKFMNLSTCSPFLCLSADIYFTLNLERRPLFQVMPLSPELQTQLQPIIKLLPFQPKQGTQIQLVHLRFQKWLHLLLSCVCICIQVCSPVDAITWSYVCVCVCVCVCLDIYMCILVVDSLMITPLGRFEPAALLSCFWM